LTNDPNHGSLCFWLVQIIQILTQCRNDAFILIGVLSKDVL
jgi:hypothetical protein